MIDTVITPSGIALPVDTRNEREIERALKQLDSDLFLTKEVYAPTGARFYAVYEYLSPTQAPLHILYWTKDRTRRGEPLPLSTGLVYAVESRKQYADRNLVAEAETSNVAMVEKSLADSDEEREDHTSFYRRRLKMGSAANSRRFFNLDKVGRE